jgi:hypothetical protein
MLKSMLAVILVVFGGVAVSLLVILAIRVSGWMDVTSLKMVRRANFEVFWWVELYINHVFFVNFLC